MPTAARRRQAVADLLGALCHSLLRVFQIAAGAVPGAPSIGLAERQAAFAVEEFERYRILRERLAAITDDPEPSMKAFRDTIDSFYEGAAGQEWLETQVFHFVGNTLTTDFADILAGRVDESTAFAVRRALTGRTEQDAFALEQITSALETGGEAARDRVARFTATMVGQGLTRLREALLSSDALEIVLGGEEAVKELVLEMLGRHRERLERLGLDTLED